MSSTSSVCSSNDADFIIDNRIVPSVRRDVERFSVFIARLRAALDVNTTVPDGESMCVSVHAALEMVSECMRDLFKHSQFKTNNVILPSLQLVQSVKDLKFDSSLVDTGRVHQVIDQLESAVLNTIINRHVVSPHPGRFSTISRTSKQSPLDSPSKHLGTLQRRHSTYHNEDLNMNETMSSGALDIDELLTKRSDGVEIAFERTKAWSTYCKDLLSYVRSRLQLEQDHAKRVNSLVETSRNSIGKPWLGLREVWEDSFSCDTELMTRTRETAEHLKDRVVEALDARRKEHDATRTTLKMEWTKTSKAVHECEESLEKSRAALRMRDDALRKAREQCLRTVSEGQMGTGDVVRRRREMEKKKRAEEEALHKRDEAEKQMTYLCGELRRKRKEMDKTKGRIVEKLRELVFQCDQTTKACSSHYFKALATLWVKLPGSYQELSDATRDFEPGSAYMSYLHNLPQRVQSNSSLLRSDRSVDEGVSCDSSSVASLRRNALNPDDEGALPDTKRHKKTSTAGRLFDAQDLSESALSHCVQRTVQPSKCAHCDRLSIVFTVQCIDCQQQWHRNCFPKTSISCGQLSSRSASLDRRMSIFGVSLKGQLEVQKRNIPLILETTIDELQKRGMRIKGIYRTCGVKSKIEEICETFERCSGQEQIDLSHVHPMNLASVIKLYLRKLPEPLLTSELYNEWVRLGTSLEDNEDMLIEELDRLVSRLPTPNRDTLRLLMLHLNRVTWFQESNLMCCSNLSTVVAPSLLWPPEGSQTSHSSYLQHTQHVNNAVQALIKHAYTVFGVDRDEDWHEFFSKYSMEEPTKEEEDAGNVSDVEDIHDEEEPGGILDDEPMFVPQPPTPDLLKNTRKTPEKASSDHWQSSPEEKPRRKERVRLKEKRRSYTTSIIISPHTERPTLASSRQRSMDERAAMSLCSGDVTIDIGKGQFVSDPPREGRAIVRRQSHKEYSTRDHTSSSSYGSDSAHIPTPSSAHTHTPLSSAHSVHRDPVHIPTPGSAHIRVHAVGELFPGTEQDVSYV